MAETLKDFHRPLGKTEIMVSPLGLGTVKFGRNEKVKYPTAFDLPDEDFLTELLSLTKSLGINLLDTAPAYGLSEQRLGRLLKDQRQDWVIVGKAGESFTNGASHYDFSSDTVRRQVEQSLKDLQTDYLDVLLLHATDGDEALCRDEELLKALQQLKSEKLVRAVGLSAKSIAAGMAGADIFDVMMLAYSPGYQDEARVIEKSHQNNCGVLLKKIFNSGHAVHDNADNVQKTFEFIFSNPGVHAAIVGTINPNHLRANAQALVDVLDQ